MPKNRNDLIKKDIAQRLKTERNLTKKPAKSTSGSQKIALLISLLITLGIIVSLLQVLF
ncbi:hypothetical protein [Liquorilactobacillus vini]|uniref:Uncharacterized protein n=1 Tax=Liquorilactobacillus vini DSM 20605 TaxID=1133569 RepID=A0A0R2CKS8_9LACO|nr:hypothetical protein [Liquorilactobacillus vini]KRM89145.1 hypothetical protein FD21_GL000194 [Liquorilactobacillus vini DSM 20605]